MMTMERPHLAKIAFIPAILGIYGVRIALDKSNIESTAVLRYFHRKMRVALEPIVVFYSNPWKFEFELGVQEEKIKNIINDLAKEMLVDVVYEW
jgi:hypothetical protein